MMWRKRKVFTPVLSDLEHVKACGRRTGWLVVMIGAPFHPAFAEEATIATVEQQISFEADEREARVPERFRLSSHQFSAVRSLEVEMVAADSCLSIDLPFAGCVEVRLQQHGPLRVFLSTR